MSNSLQSKPQARTSELIVKALGDELVVYDTARDKAHCLNQTSAAVWKFCDGTRSASEIAQSVSRELGKPVEVSVVWYALTQLERYHLLTERVALPSAYAGMTRREFGRTLAKAALAVAVPLIVSVSAPTPAHAANCLPQGSMCTQNAQCCSNNCMSNVCQ